MNHLFEYNILECFGYFRCHQRWQLENPRTGHGGWNGKSLNSMVDFPASHVTDYQRVIIVPCGAFSSPQSHNVSQFRGATRRLPGVFNPATGCFRFSHKHVHNP